MSDEIHHHEVIDKGWTSTVYRVKDTCKVVKVIDDPCHREYCDREEAVYMRLWQAEKVSESILKFFGKSECFSNGLVLQYAENGNMHKYLWDCNNVMPGNRPDQQLLRKWALQTSDGLVFVHGCGVLHCDIHVANLFLDNLLNVKIGDFGASSIDESKPLRLYRKSHQLWSEKDGKWQREFSHLSEIFAFGSTLYNMETAHDPFEALYTAGMEAEIVQRLRERDMPSLAELSSFDTIIHKCWQGQYTCMAELSGELRSRSSLVVAE